MTNKLSDLNNYLFEALERVNDDSLDAEGLDREIKRAETVVRISDSIVKNGELQLKALKHAEEYGYNGGPHVISTMLPDNQSKGTRK